MVGAISEPPEFLAYAYWESWPADKNYPLMIRGVGCFNHNF